MADSSGNGGRRPRVAFITEQHVGLRTYSENLRHFVDRDDRIQADWLPVTYLGDRRWWDRARVVPQPLRSALRGRDQVRSAVRKSTPDVCFFMTQAPAALGGSLVRTRPYVVMIDDTPILYDDMASHFDQSPDRFPPLKAAKHRINVKALREANAVLPMSEWARSSLIGDYGVDPERAIVASTGVDLQRWMPATSRVDGPLRVLFVGGHFERKGGDVLLRAISQFDTGTIEVHLVTRSTVPETAGVRVHTSMEPNSPTLIDLYRSCDVFVLPSRAEAYPNALMEACATGLPCIVTRVGAMAEMIIHGSSGFVIEPDDWAALVRSLRDLVDDPDRRATMSREARLRAEQMFDGERNARRIVDLLLTAAAT